MPRIRATPEDFSVDEIPLYPPSGEGEHTFLRIEKTGRTTEEVARALARQAGVRPRDVGYAGRKDRAAVTTQWLSVPGLDPERAADLTLPGVRVLEAVRHVHKLRTGQLRGNRFCIIVREMEAPQRSAARERFERVAAEGMANHYGAQRFGRDGDNVSSALRLIRGERLRVDRRAARFLLSALQAAVFNDVLDDRPRPLHHLEVGDVAVVEASGGLFRVEDAERETARAAAFEIGATGPIFGSKVLEPTGLPALREAAALAARGVPPDAARTPPAGIRLRGARRALRVRPGYTGLEELADGVRLSFTLPPGSYATVLIREVIGEEPLEGGADTVRRSALS